MESSKNTNEVQGINKGINKIPFVPATDARHLKIGQWQELYYRVCTSESSPEINQQNNDK